MLSNVIEGFDIPLLDGFPGMVDVKRQEIPNAVIDSSWSSASCTTFLCIASKQGQGETAVRANYSINQRVLHHTRLLHPLIQDDACSIIKQAGVPIGGSILLGGSLGAHKVEPADLRLKGFP